MNQGIIIGNMVCAIVSAKWALELGHSQSRQILFLIGGLLFGPFTLLVLYVYLVNKAKSDGLLKAKMF